MIEFAENNADAALMATLDELLAKDEDITARAAARLHPTLNAASSITRSVHRSALLAQYQQRQQQYREWSKRVGKQSTAQLSAGLAARDIRIAELEEQLALLTASHVMLIREAGEMGGFKKWAELFSKFSRHHGE